MKPRIQVVALVFLLVALAFASTSHPASAAQAFSFHNNFDSIEGFKVDNEMGIVCGTEDPGGGAHTISEEIFRNSGSSLLVSSNSDGAVNRNHYIVANRVSENGVRGIWAYSVYAYIDPSTAETGEVGPEISVQNTLNGFTRTAGIQYVANIDGGGGDVEHHDWLLWVRSGENPDEAEGEEGPAELATWTEIGHYLLEAARWYRLELIVDYDSMEYISASVQGPGGKHTFPAASLEIAREVKRNLNGDVFDDGVEITYEAENRRDCATPTKYDVYYDDADFSPAIIVDGFSDSSDLDLTDGVCGTEEGGCTLRAAIQTANETVGVRETIAFDLQPNSPYPRSAPYTIVPESDLPRIRDSIRIDGSTQPGYATHPVVGIDGRNLNHFYNGGDFKGTLNVVAGNSEISFLNLSGTGKSIGLSIIFGDNNVIRGNYIGTDHTGNEPQPNFIGIALGNTENNLIGGPEPFDRNVISGNSSFLNSRWSAGILFLISPNNRIQGNAIGSDITGQKAIPNMRGIYVHTFRSNDGLIGSDVGLIGKFETIDGGLPRADESSLRNIIAYNNLSGITISGGAPSWGWRILGNAIFENGRYGDPAEHLDVELAPVGPDAAHPDELDRPANSGQSAPVILSIDSTGLIRYRLPDSTPGASYQVDFYQHDRAHVHSHGGGRWWSGTRNIVAGDDEQAIYEYQIDKPVVDRVTSAMVTNIATGNTSEFSNQIAKDLYHTTNDQDVFVRVPEVSRSIAFHVDRLPSYSESLHYRVGSNGPLFNVDLNFTTAGGRVCINPSGFGLADDEEAVLYQHQGSGFVPLPTTSASLPERFGGENVLCGDDALLAGHIPPITVNSVADPGDGRCTLEECTLREAIEQSNSGAGHRDRITFDLPVEEPAVIELQSLLPLVTDGLDLDGGEDRGEDNLVTLLGSSVETKPGDSGLTITALGANISNLGFAGFESVPALTLWSARDGSGRHTVSSNTFGRLPLSNSLSPNLWGIRVHEVADNDVIANDIIGFSGAGIFIDGDSNVVQGNSVIGIENSNTAIWLHSGASNNVVGGLDPGEGNSIENARFGVALRTIFPADTISNTISGNRIVGTEIPIDIGDDVEDRDDEDRGPNLKQNSPVVQSVVDGKTITVHLDVPLEGGSFRIEYFWGERDRDAERLIGFADFETSGQIENFQFVSPETLISGFVTATATNLDTGDTSELSAGFGGFLLPCGLTQAGEPDRSIPTHPLMTPADGELGAAVALSQQFAVVGLPERNAVDVFENTGSSWHYMTRLFPGPGGYDGFGTSVDVSGNVVVVGAPATDGSFPAEGSAFAFCFDGQTWSEPVELAIRTDDPLRGDQFGTAVATDGTTIVVGAITTRVPSDREGRVHVYQHDTFSSSADSWNHAQELSAPGTNWLGLSLDIAGDALAVAGAGTVHTSRRLEGGNWTSLVPLESPGFTPAGKFGWQLDVSESLLVVGDPDADNRKGAAYIYELGDSEWNFAQVVVDPTRSDIDSYGSAVAIAGDTVLVGVPADFRPEQPNIGSVAAYSKDGDAFVLQNSLFLHDALDGSPPSGSKFGTGLASAGSHVLISAPGVNPNGMAIVVNVEQPGLNFEDADSDGIDDDIDHGFTSSGDCSGEIADVFEPTSSSFSDRFTDLPHSGSTWGCIRSTPRQTKIQNLSEPLGVLVDGTNVADGSGEIVSACGFDISVRKGDQFAVTCASLRISVQAGSPTVANGSHDLTIPAGADIKLQTLADLVLVRNLASDEAAAELLLDGVPLEVPAGRTITLSGAAPGQVKTENSLASIVTDGWTIDADGGVTEIELEARLFPIPVGRSSRPFGIHHTLVSPLPAASVGCSRIDSRGISSSSNQVAVLASRLCVRDGLYHLVAEYLFHGPLYSGYAYVSAFSNPDKQGLLLTWVAER